VNGSNVDQLNVRGPYAAALVGENILLRAQRLLSEHGVRLGSVHLDKQLPIASGIGGGSADAAAMLRAAQRANPELADAPWWGEIAAVLGSDVPVCVASLPTLMTGTGQMMAPVHDFPTLHAVLVNPLTAVPADKSAQVFRALGLASGTGTPAKPPMAPRFRDAADALAYVSARDNRLTAPAATVVPEIPAVLAAISELPGCRLSRMSGAGPTCFGLFESPSAAAAATASLAHRQPAWWVFATRLG
jgi:4-diphosphocytidyl-2-C-methyl-D-erythritol kinase